MRAWLCISCMFSTYVAVTQSVVVIRFTAVRELSFCISGIPKMNDVLTIWKKCCAPVVVLHSFLQLVATLTVQNILAALFAAGSAQHVRGTDMCAVAFDNKQQTGLQAITELRYAAAIYTIQHQQAMYTIATALNVYMKPHICCTSRLSAASHSAKQQ
eukprot:18505-Heterococcus_DN1.PRE.2